MKDLSRNELIRDAVCPVCQSLTHMQTHGQAIRRGRYLSYGNRNKTLEPGVWKGARLSSLVSSLPIHAPEPITMQYCILATIQPGRAASRRLSDHNNNTHNNKHGCCWQPANYLRKWEWDRRRRKRRRKPREKTQTLLLDDLHQRKKLKEKVNTELSGKKSMHG